MTAIMPRHRAISQQHVSELEGILPEEIQAFDAIDISTITTLWRRIGVDVDQGVMKLARDLAIPEARLAELLCQQANDEANRPLDNALRRYLLESILAGIVAIFIILVVHAFSVVEMQTWRQYLPWPHSHQQNTKVLSAHDLPAYHLIVSNDLVVEQIDDGDTKGLQEEGEAIGRFTLTRIEEGASLSTDQLSTMVDSITGWSILTVPLAVPVIDMSLPGQYAQLLLVPRPTTQEVTQDAIAIGAVVLSVAIADQRAAVTVAVHGRDLAVLSQALGGSDVYVVVPAISQVVK